MTAGLTVLLAVASASVNTHVKVETVNFDEDLLNTEKNIAETFAWKEKKDTPPVGGSPAPPVGGSPGDYPCAKFVTNADGEGYITVKTGDTTHHTQKKLANEEELEVCPGGEITEIVVQNTNSDGWVGAVTVIKDKADKGVLLKCTKNCDQKDCLTDNLKVDGDEKAYKNKTNCMCMGGKECTLEPTEETPEEKKE